MNLPDLSAEATPEFADAKACKAWLENVPLESWKVENESAQGLRMVRPAGSAGKRYAHGQLVAVRPTGLNVQNEKYVPALALGAVQALNAL